LDGFGAVGAAGGGGAAAVVNDQTAPVVEPASFLATTCQKYVVPAARFPGAYDAAAWPVETCGGGLLVPKLTSKLFAPEALQFSVGAVLTPVAPSVGFGDEGAAGGAAAVDTFTLSSVEVLSVDVL